MEKALKDPITADEVDDTQRYLTKFVTRTPLVPLHETYQNRKIYLKLENLSPIGCFKLRGGFNCLRHLTKDELSRGVYTASAGNFAQGLATACQHFDVPCRVLVPHGTCDAKRRAIKKLGGQVMELQFDDWWNVIENGEYPGMAEKFIHPTLTRDNILGCSIIGKEIYEDLPDVDTVIAGYGGGAMLTGISSALKTLKPSVKIMACEVETATPLTAAFKAGKPTTTEFKRSFVGGIGCPCVVTGMWDLVRKAIDDVAVVTLDSIAYAIRLLVERNHVIAEGAGAAPVAAAINGLAGDGKIVCIVSGGNIDTDTLITILNGCTP